MNEAEMFRNEFFNLEPRIIKSLQNEKANAIKHQDIHNSCEELIMI